MANGTVQATLQLTRNSRLPKLLVGRLFLVVLKPASSDAWATSATLLFQCRQVHQQADLFEWQAAVADKLVVELA